MYTCLSWIMVWIQIIPFDSMKWQRVLLSDWYLTHNYIICCFQSSSWKLVLSKDGTMLTHGKVGMHYLDTSVAFSAITWSFLNLYIFHSYMIWCDTLVIRQLIVTTTDILNSKKAHFDLLYVQFHKPVTLINMIYQITLCY